MAKIFPNTKCDCNRLGCRFIHIAQKSTFLNSGGLKINRLVEHFRYRKDRIILDAIGFRGQKFFSRSISQCEHKTVCFYKNIPALHWVDLTSV